jgi:phage baseplate assembly protein gpV
MATVTDPFQEETFRPAFGRTLAGALIAICALSALSAVGTGREQLLLIWPWLGLVGFAAWAMYWRPEVRVDAAGVHVVNVFRTVDVPWPAIDEVDTRWALTLVTRLGDVRAWAAPAPGRQVMRRARPEDRRMGGTRRGDVVRPSDLPQTESGAAAQIVRQRWLRLRKDGHLDDARLEFDRLPTRWHVGVIVGFAVLVPLTIYGTWAA